MQCKVPLAVALLMGASLANPIPTRAADACPHRGQLDEVYCDADHDLVADPPSDPQRLRDPDTLVFTDAPVEDLTAYDEVFRPFTDYLAQCTGKRVVYYPVQSNSAEIEAMRSGRLHVAGFSTGPTGFAVNMAGAVPFAGKGTAERVHGYQLLMLVRKESPYERLSDLKGRNIAHTSPSSNSGNLAPQVLFPPQGLKPGQDYAPVFSGGHDRSAIGVARGDYDAAPVASDVFERMVVRGTIKREDYRIIYTSEVFPTSSFALAHDLRPELAQKIKQCFSDFRFTPEMRREFNGDDRFVPITYAREWAVVRRVADESGAPYTKAAYEREAAREAEAARREATQARRRVEQKSN
jgi:phosphonate transport system substrate-binding protein